MLWQSAGVQSCRTTRLAGDLSPCCLRTSSQGLQHEGFRKAGLLHGGALRRKERVRERGREKGKEGGREKYVFRLRKEHRLHL